MHAHTHTQNLVPTTTLTGSVCRRRVRRTSAEPASPEDTFLVAWVGCFHRRASSPTTSTASGRRAALTLQPHAPFSTS
eukprot:4633767-Pleurochrysis_carterae.AAC.1